MLGGGGGGVGPHALARYCSSWRGVYPPKSANTVIASASCDESPKIRLNKGLEVSCSGVAGPPTSPRAGTSSCGERGGTSRDPINGLAVAPARAT